MAATPVYGALRDHDEIGASTPLQYQERDLDATPSPSKQSTSSGASRSMYIGLACVATAMVAGVNHATGGGVVAMLSTKAETQAKAKAATSSGLDFIAYSADYSHASALKTAGPHSFIKENRLVEPIKDTGQSTER